MLRTLLFAGFALLACSCAPAPTMDLDDFDRTCAADADCELVFTGVCGCSCERAAIRTSEIPRYTSEQESKQEDCEHIPCPPCWDPVKDNGKAICENKRCVAK